MYPRLLSYESSEETRETSVILIESLMKAILKAEASVTVVVEC